MMSKRYRALLSIFALILIFISIFSSLFFYSVGHNDIAWCYEEYRAVDRSIEQCIDDEQDTIEGCVQFYWRDKSYLINEMGCPG